MSCFCSELSILCFCLWLCAYFCSLVVTFNFCWYMFIACNRQSCFMTWVYFYHNLLIVCGWRPLLVFLKCIVPRIPEAVSVFCSSFLLFFFFSIWLWISALVYRNMTIFLLLVMGIIFFFLPLIGRTSPSCVIFWSCHLYIVLWEVFCKSYFTHFMEVFDSTVHGCLWFYCWILLLISFGIWFTFSLRLSWIPWALGVLKGTVIMNAYIIWFMKNCYYMVNPCCVSNSCLII